VSAPGPVPDRSAGGPRVDVAAERASTPGTAFAHHLNSAGSALPSTGVLGTVIEHLRLEARIGGYEAATAERDRIDAVYAQAAALLGAEAGDIAQVESATVAWQRAVDALRLGPGDRVLAARSSYVSSALHLLELARSRGVEVEILPADETGATDLEALAEALRRPAALVTASHVPTSSGLVEPVAAIGALARAAGVTYLLDATQSVGQMAVDVAEIGCDVLFTTGRKFLRAPRGTGLLYVAPALRETLRPLTPDVRGAVWAAERDYDLRPTAVRFETWEASHALRLGLGVALAECRALGVGAVRAHLDELGPLLRERLAEVPGVRVVDPPAAGGGIVTFVRDGEDPGDTQRALQRHGLHVVSVPASHGQWDLGHRGLPAVVRASLHVYNGPDDVDALIAALHATAPRGRGDGGPTPAAGADPATVSGAAAAGDGPAAIGVAGTASPARSDAASSAAGALVSSAIPAASGTGAAAARRAAAAPVERADVVVIGAGVHGSSAAWQLARRGHRVIQLERFRAGHVEGSSHGRTRMIRRAYPSPVWDGFVDRAYASWADLEGSTDTTLVTRLGGLYARPASAEGGLRGPGCELVDPARARELFPALHLQDGFEAVYDPAAGVVDAAGAMEALRLAGAAAGVDRREATPALSWREDADGVVIETPAGRLHADRLVVCAGPWIGELVPELRTALEVIRIVNIHVGATDPALVSAPALGAFSVDVPDVGLLYGMPAIGGASLKVGLDHGPADDVESPRRPVSDAEIELLHGLVRRFLPDADGAVDEVLSCRYTMAPRNRFAIGTLPAHPAVLVAAACSGHGFKFGPAVGEALADLATGVARPDLDFLDPAAMIGEVAPTG
jgi:selenocysteine lyase/cysteine desulfurase/glycine/D-amino acid oxidase-like deaminating enzyme